MSDKELKKCCRFCECYVSMNDKGGTCTLNPPSLLLPVPPPPGKIQQPGQINFRVIQPPVNGDNDHCSYFSNIATILEMPSE